MFRKIYWNRLVGMDIFIVGPFASDEQAHNWIDDLVAYTVPDLEVSWETATRAEHPYKLYPPTMSPMEIFTERMH